MALRGHPNVVATAEFPCGIDLTERDLQSTEPGVLNDEKVFTEKKKNLQSGPAVEVHYRQLTTKSRNKLKEVLQAWLHWQIENASTSHDLGTAGFESGCDTYFPLFDKSAEVELLPVWEDIPVRQNPQLATGKENSHSYELHEGKTVEACTNDTLEVHESSAIKNPSFNVAYEKVNTIPNYEVSKGSPLTLKNGKTKGSLARFDSRRSGGSRCFNCGAYGHALRNCPNPRDEATIRSARDEHIDSKGVNGNVQGGSRYHRQSSGRNEQPFFSDLKPGVLSPETLEALGIKETDPPPWLRRMREIGYPPDYLEGPTEDKDTIQVFDDELETLGKGITVEVSQERELGEIEGENEDADLESKVPSVIFPGYNGPPPEGADEKLWSLRPNEIEMWRNSQQAYVSPSASTQHYDSWLENGRSLHYSNSRYRVPSPPTRKRHFDYWQPPERDYYMGDQPSMHDYSQDVQSWATAAHEYGEQYYEDQGTHPYQQPIDMQISPDRHYNHTPHHRLR